MVSGLYGSGNVNIGATAASVFRPKVLGTKCMGLSPISTLIIYSD
jgi:hypothetical protein